MNEPVNCEVFRRWIFHFQADEVPDGDRTALQDHLDACPECARRLEAEEVLLGALKSSLGRRQAPPGLETRIRASLDAETPRARASAWWRAPWLAAAAASALLAVLLVPTLRDHGGAPGDTATTVRHVVREAVLVDLECDKAGRSFAEQRDCTAPGHVNALKLDDGNYWNIVPESEVHRAVLTDRERRGQRVVVEGDYYPWLGTMHLERIDGIDRTIL